jgi:DNA primase
VLAAGVDQEALDAAAKLAPDNADMLRQLIEACLALGEQANFAALAEQLRTFGPDFEPLVAEIAADTESDPEAARLELAGAIRQTKMQVLKAELERLATTGLATEEARTRYRELMQRQEQLRRQAEVENIPR